MDREDEFELLSDDERYSEDELREAIERLRTLNLEGETQGVS
jgi:hypothetical protein